MEVLVFIGLLSLINGFEIHEGVIFEKTNEITTTKSQWKMALIMDVSVFQNALDKLESDIALAENISVHMLTNYNETVLYQNIGSSQKQGQIDDLENNAFVNSLSNIKHEIQFLRASYQQIIESYMGYKVLHNRQERSLLPFSGFFKFLFGTAKDEDLSALQRNVKKLANTQRSILHVLESNLSILNISRNDISQNRKSINGIIKALELVDQNVQKITGKMERQIHNLEQYTVMYNNLQTIINQVRDLNRHAQVYLNHFERQINMLALSRLSPSMITPANLKALLNDIMAQVPPSYILPVNIETHLWDFYKILECDTFLYDDQIAIIVHIPLLDLDGRLNVYKIHNLDIPYASNASTSNNNRLAMTAKYNLDTVGLVVNAQRTSFGILNSEELLQCSDPIKKFCQFESPMYHVALSQRCSIALFTKNQEKIVKFCHINVSPNTKLPVAEYLFQGNWVITTNINLRFVIICHVHDRKKYELVVYPPMQFIKLDMNCRAFNDFITLGSYYENSSKNKIQMVQEFIDFPNISNFHIWAPFKEAFGNNYSISIPKHMREIEKIPMDKLITNLKNLRAVEISATPFELPYWVYILIAMSALGIIAIIYCYIKIKHPCNKSKRNRPCTRNVTDIPLSYVSVPGKDNAMNDDMANDVTLLQQEMEKTTSVPFLRRLYPKLESQGQ